MSELWRLTAGELAGKVRAREVSAREAAVSALARLGAVNGAINAVVAHDEAQVLARADAVDRMIAAGGEAGPLAGVPVTVKVNTDQVGFASTNGLLAQKDLVAAGNNPVVDNLEKAGAVILGRTNTPAFSLRWFTDNLVHGATRNPHNATITPGGSSGGAGAAVAAGIGHIAHGTDIAGSIRYPAYACGVHGLRPSLGRVPAWNASGPERTVGAQIMAVSGPLARTVGDVRLGFQALMGADARDPWYVPVPFAGPAVPKRVGLCVRPDGMAVVPEVEAAVLAAAKRLEAAGYVVEEVAVPGFREARELNFRLWLGDGWAGFRAAVEKEGEPGALAVMENLRPLAEAMPADVVAQTLVRRATITREWLRFLADWPLLLMPVSGELPFPDGLDKVEGSWERLIEAQLVQIGLPVMALPGLTVSTGMVGTVPVGVQIIGQRYREDLMLAAGEVIENPMPMAMG